MSIHLYTKKIEILSEYIILPNKLTIKNVGQPKSVYKPKLHAYKKTIYK